MIQWQKYFDKIICINFCQFTERKKLMEFELKRVGILDCPVFEWLFTYKGPYERMFKDMLDPEDKIYSESTLSCILGHLNATKKAYYSGCKNVLVIEDDERFLRDLNKIEDILEKMPEGQYDVLLFDKFITYGGGGLEGYKKLISNKEKYLNQFYISYTQRILSAGCYCLSRHGMQTIINLTDEGDVTTFDTYFNYQKLNDVWKKVCTAQNLSVQAVFMDAENFVRSGDISSPNEKSLHFQHVYKNQQLNFDDYMMRIDGSKYDYGDYIDI